MDWYKLSPLSEKTLSKHKYNYKGLTYLNDFGFPCDYRVLSKNKELGRIKYYAGRKLMAYELAKKGN